jgi:hypothetical protein
MKMGVDVYHIKPPTADQKEFVKQAHVNVPDLVEAIEINLGNREWLMQFSTSYLVWLHWIITASGEDPSRVGMVLPLHNKRYLPILSEGHPWDRRGITLRDEDCVILKKDLAWFIEEKMPHIKDCDYLKIKTELFYRAVEKVAEAGGVLYIG